MIWRIRDRRTFDRFRRDGRRVRVGPLWMSVIADPLASPPRVAFAVGRTVGSAPLRNRVRRRLRALVRAHAADLAPGWYLIGADASFASSPFPTVDAQFQALTKAATPDSPPAAGPAWRHEDER